MLGVEDAVDRRQGDVLVAAAVANDVMRVEQLVVVGEFAAPAVGGDGVPRIRVIVRADRGGRRLRDAVDVGDTTGLGVASDVIEEGVAGAQHIGADALRGGEIAFDEAGGGDQLGQAVRAGDELAVGVREDHRHVEHVGVAQLDAQHGAGHQLDFAPVDDRAARAFGKPAGGDRLAEGVQRVLAQENLVGGVRAVVLAQVDQRCGGVDVAAHVVGGTGDAVGTWRAGGDGCPRQRHEAQVRGKVVAVAEDSVGPRDQWVVGVQRHDHCAVATGADLVQAVVEELAEDCEKGVVGGRQALVRGHVLDEQRAIRRHHAGADLVVHRHGSGIAGALVGDQVADHARL